MKVHLETMEKPLHKTCVTFTQNKVVEFHLGDGPKMCNSLNNIIMRTGHQWLERKQQSRMYTWKQWSLVTGTLRNGYTRRTEQFHWKNEWKIEGKNVWQSTQRNCENGSTMTEKEVIKWRVHFETVEKC